MKLLANDDEVLNYQLISNTLSISLKCSNSKLSMYVKLKVCVPVCVFHSTAMKLFKGSEMEKKLYK